MKNPPLDGIELTFFVLKHPSLGYLCGTRSNRYWHSDIKGARKWNRRNDASNCKAQSEYEPEIMQQCWTIPIYCVAIEGSVHE